MKRLIDATALAALLAVAATASADTRAWTPGVSGSWDDDAKWSPNGIPADGDVVQFGGTYNADTIVTVGNTATVAFPDSTSISGGGKLILQGLSPSARTLTVNNTASDLQITGGPLEFSGLTANIAVPASNKRFFLTGGGSNGPTRLILSGDSAVTLSGTMLLLSGDNNTQGSRVEINDTASLAMSGAEMQPGRGQNTWGGVVQRGGAVNAGDVKFGYNANSFGAWEMFEGTNTFSGDTWLSYNGGNAANAAGAASLYVHGGLLSLGGNMHFGYWGRSEAFIDGGKVSFNGQKLSLVNRASDLADLPSVLTIAKNAVVTAKKIYPYGDEYSNYSGQSRAMVNLNGDGLLSLTDTFMVNASGTTRATLSFNGGTLERVTGSPDSDANKNLLKGVDAVVYPGGGKLKARTSTGAVSGMTLNNAKFRKAGGWGVASIAVTSGGSGYLLPPLVDITGGSGSNATAVAQIDYDTGAVTNVVVTCPGEGYAAGDTLTVSFVVPSKPAITAATAIATLAENTAGTLRIVDGSTVSLGATFRYDGDFAMDTGTQVPITGNITLGGTSAFKGLDVRDNATLVFAGSATANDAVLKELGTIAITENGTLAVTGHASFRGTVAVARTSATPLITVGGNCSFAPATGSTAVATLIPAEGLRAAEPIPVVSVSGTVTGELTLDASATDEWSIRTKTENGATTIYLCPRKRLVIVVR